MHAKDVHQMNFSLKIFSISLVKKVSPQQLRREEFKFIYIDHGEEGLCVGLWGPNLSYLHQSGISCRFGKSRSYTLNPVQ